MMKSNGFIVGMEENVSFFRSTLKYLEEGIRLPIYSQMVQEKQIAPLLQTLLILRLFQNEKLKNIYAHFGHLIS